MLARLENPDPLPPPPVGGRIRGRFSWVGGCMRSRPFRLAVGTCEVIQVMGLFAHLTVISTRILLAVGVLQAPAVEPTHTPGGVLVMAAAEVADARPFDI